MSSLRAAARAIGRVWGRRDLPSWASAAGSGPTGEIWHEGAGADAALLIKHIFTAERLSIQVHPDDDDARARGFPRGKDEAWYILEAEPDATIGIGLTHDLSKEDLRAAARDGSIVGLVDWRPVRAGELIYSPGGTIHAIGGGIALIEVQQNLDLTYRLYDYGRPRALHLDEAVAVADPRPCRFHFTPVEPAPGRTVLVAGAAFVVERWTFTRPARLLDETGELLLTAIASGGALDGAPLAAGAVWRIEGAAELRPGGRIDLLAAYPGDRIRADLLAFS